MILPHLAKPGMEISLVPEVKTPIPNTVVPEVKTCTQKTQETTLKIFRTLGSPILPEGKVFGFFRNFGLTGGTTLLINSLNPPIGLAVVCLMLAITYPIGQWVYGLSKGVETPAGSYRRCSEIFDLAPSGVFLTLIRDLNPLPQLILGPIMIAFALTSYLSDLYKMRLPERIQPALEEASRPSFRI